MNIKQDELLRVLLDTPVLKKQIDEYLDDGWKINAIKELKLWCETTSYPAWLKDLAPKLRLSKDVIDAYCVRVSILRKLNKLSNQIEKYCNKHGYNKMGFKEGAKSKDGLYTHKYTDYELVDDHIGFIVNNLDWYPNSTNYKEYNKLWRKYNVKYYKNIRY